MKTRWSRRLALLPATGGAALFLSATPALAAESLNVAPPTGLAPGQVVTVNVSGFTDPDPQTITLVQCSPTATSIAGCDVEGSQDILFTNGDGTGSAPFTLTTKPGVCDAAVGCAIFAVEDPNNFSAGSARSDIILSAGGDPDPVVPEVGKTILLPLLAASIAVVVAIRRRANG